MERPAANRALFFIAPGQMTPVTIDTGQVIMGSVEDDKKPV
jgi:hypothetical protein